MIRIILATVTAVALTGIARADEIEFGGLKSKTPDGWKKQEVRFPAIQVGLFALPKADGDADAATVSISFGGATGMGSEKDNLERWKKAFNPPLENAKIEKMKVGTAAVTYFDGAGTYDPPARPNQPKADKKDDYRLIGVIFDSPKGPYYVRFVGPAKSVEKNKKEFDEWLKNFK